MSTPDIAGAMPQSDYEAVGGGPAIASVVNRFYELVLADPNLAPFFENTDIVGLKRHQVKLVSQVMGGPAEYEGQELREAHAHLDIGDEHFTAVVVHLVASLQEHGVPPEVIERVVGELGKTQPDIVTAGTG